MILPPNQCFMCMVLHKWYLAVFIGILKGGLEIRRRVSFEKKSISSANYTFPMILIQIY